MPKFLDGLTQVATGYLERVNAESALQKKADIEAEKQKEIEASRYESIFNLELKKLDISAERERQKLALEEEKNKIKSDAFRRVQQGEAGAEALVDVGYSPSDALKVVMQSKYAMNTRQLTQGGNPFIPTNKTPTEIMDENKPESLQSKFTTAKTNAAIAKMNDDAPQAAQWEAEAELYQEQIKVANKGLDQSIDPIIIRQLDNKVLAANNSILASKDLLEFTNDPKKNKYLTALAQSFGEVKTGLQQISNFVQTKQDVFVSGTKEDINSLENNVISQLTNLINGIPIDKNVSPEEQEYIQEAKAIAARMLVAKRGEIFAGVTNTSDAEARTVDTFNEVGNALASVESARAYAKVNMKKARSSLDNLEQQARDVSPATLLERISNSKKSSDNTIGDLLAEPSATVSVESVTDEVMTGDTQDLTPLQKALQEQARRNALKQQGK